MLACVGLGYSAPKLCKVEDLGKSVCVVSGSVQTMDFNGTSFMSSLVGYKLKCSDVSPLPMPLVIPTTVMTPQTAKPKYFSCKCGCKAH